MTNSHPITPPLELIYEWVTEVCPEYGKGVHFIEEHVATQAAQWGADQELEACCEVLARELICDGKHVATDLRAVRRPKPPSLKEQALHALLHMDQGQHNERTLIIRSALEQLPD